MVSVNVREYCWEGHGAGQLRVWVISQWDPQIVVSLSWQEP